MENIASYFTSLALPILAVTVVFVAFSFMEMITPAGKIPTADERFLNFRLFLLIDVLLAPIITLPIIVLVKKLVVIAGGGLIYVDLAAIANKFHGIAQPIASGLLALIPMLVYDFFFYWWHRWQHTSTWLWEEHKLHHSDGNVNVTTTKRQHFLEVPLTSFFIGLPLALCFSFTPVTAVLTTALIRVWQFFIHANLRWPFGWLTLVFCGPQYHRIHHSIEPQHLNKNFAVWFPVWDVIFGTYYIPHRDEFPQTGVIGELPNPTWRHSLFGPFAAWNRMIRQYLNRRGTVGTQQNAREDQGQGM